MKNGKSGVGFRSTLMVGFVNLQAFFSLSKLLYLTSMYKTCDLFLLSNFSLEQAFVKLFVLLQSMLQLRIAWSYKPIQPLEVLIYVKVCMGVVMMLRELVS